MTHECLTRKYRTRCLTIYLDIWSCGEQEITLQSSTLKYFETGLHFAAFLRVSSILFYFINNLFPFRQILLSYMASFGIPDFWLDETKVILPDFEVCVCVCVFVLKSDKCPVK